MFDWGQMRESAHWIIIQSKIRLIHIKLWGSGVDMRDRAVMNCWCNASCMLLHIQSFVSCNWTSNDIMIELLTLKSLKVICFTKSSFEFDPWNRIEKNIKESFPVTLGSKIIYSLKENIDCDQNDEEYLDKRPHEMSYPAWDCNPRKKTFPSNTLVKNHNWSNC